MFIPYDVSTLVDAPRWVVSVHSGWGSMAEAVEPMATYGPLDRQAAVDLANAFNKELGQLDSSGDTWAIVEPLEETIMTDPEDIVREALKGEAFDYVTGRW